MAYTLQQHQAVLLEMLCQVDKICRKYDIPYTLFSGTALGAVQHEGFVPWDDDLDVIMLRRDYRRFLQVAPGELGENYFLQKEFSQHWPMFFSKLRKNGTACMERFVPRDPLMHQGVCMDIFPCDNLSDKPLKRRLQFAASKLVIAGSLFRRGYITRSPAKKLLMQLSRVLPLGALHRYVLDEKEPQSRTVHSFFGASSRYGHSVYDRRWFTERIYLPFAGKAFPVSAHYEQLLTVLYGDWRLIPPPEERRCKVHGEIVDLDRSYENYLQQQKEKEYDILSHSIR